MNTLAVTALVEGFKYLTSRKNLTSASTIGAILPATTAGVLVAQEPTIETLSAAVVSSIIALWLFMRKSKV